MIQKLHNALEEYNSDTSYCGYTMAYDSGEFVSVPAYYNRQVFCDEEIIDKVLLEMVAGKPEAPKDAMMPRKMQLSFRLKKMNKVPSRLKSVQLDITSTWTYNTSKWT